MVQIIQDRKDKTRKLFAVPTVPVPSFQKFSTIAISLIPTMQQRLLFVDSAVKAISANQA